MESIAFTFQCLPYHFCFGPATTVTINMLCKLQFTILWYAPKQIWSPHCTCMSNCNATVVYIHSYMYQSKTNTLQHSFTILLPHMCQQQICPANTTCSNYMMCINGECMQVYMPHMSFLSSMTSQEMFYTVESVKQPDVYTVFSHISQKSFLHKSSGGGGGRETLRRRNEKVYSIYLNFQSLLKTM